MAAANYELARQKSEFDPSPETVRAEADALSRVAILVVNTVETFRNSDLMPDDIFAKVRSAGEKIARMQF
jgi:hypothetical protein